MNLFDCVNRQLLQNGTIYQAKNDEQQGDPWDMKPKMIELIEHS